MPRESADEKALRFVRERNVRILYVDMLDAERVELPSWPVQAKVRGDGSEYSVGWQVGVGWRCSCEANSKFRRRCSHIRAVALVVLPPD